MATWTEGIRIYNKDIHEAIERPAPSLDANNHMLNALSGMKLRIRSFMEINEPQIPPISRVTDLARKVAIAAAS
jgi:hypothetical protein